MAVVGRRLAAISKRAARLASRVRSRERLARRFLVEAAHAPIENALVEAWTIRESLAPPVPGVRSLVRSGIGLNRTDSDAWLGAAGWSWIACNLVMRELRAGKLETVLQLVDVPDLTSEQEQVLNGPVVLTGAHLGAPVVARLWAAQCLRDTVALVGRKNGQYSNRDWIVSGPDAQRGGTVRAVLHLRAGGALYAAPDGQQGEHVVPVCLFGREVTLGPGVSAIARAAGVQSLPFAALWTNKQRIQISVGDPLPETTEQPDSQAAWCDAWARWFENVVRWSPVNAHCAGGGVWRASHGGLLQ